MRKLALSMLCVGLMASGVVAHAKVVDPKPVIEQGVVYRSHANYVEARIKKSDKLLWKQVVFEQPGAEQSVPGLEQDVQWLIINAIVLQGDRIRVQNNKGQVFFLDKKTGHLLPDAAEK